MLYAGVCHTDVHYADNSMGHSIFPLVPGHELLGRVSEIGANISKFKVGDNCAVGSYIDCCSDCKQCNTGSEQYCDKGWVPTYNGPKKYGRATGNPDVRTLGGYTSSVTVHENFVFLIPEGMPLERCAPIFCGGVGTYGALKYYGFVGGAKRTVGIVGIGGLGSIGIKIAAALGHEVVAISTNPAKEQLAKEKGANHFVLSSNPESVAAHAGKCDIILNLLSVPHDLKTYIPLLAKSGVLCQMGAVGAPH